MQNKPERSIELAVRQVPQVGRLVDTGDRVAPWTLLDSAGEPVESVAAYFGELQAAGRSTATLRSYGMDLLRWFRFLWAVGVAWDRATQSEARDFCRWLLVAGKPVRVHWRNQEHPPALAAGRGSPTRPAYSASVRAHSESVLRGFYDFARDVGTGPILNPFPLDRSRRGGGRTRIAIRWSPRATSGPGGIGRRCRAGSRAVFRMRSSTRSSRGCLRIGIGR